MPIHPEIRSPHGWLPALRGLALALLLAPLPLLAAEGQAYAQGGGTIEEGHQDSDSDVARLHRLLQAYQRDTEAVADADGPSIAEQALRAEAGRDAQRLAGTAPAADQIQLSGEEGSRALAQISLRLADAAVPESRRDTALLASVRTYLLGKLIFSERISLRAIGKDHHIAVFPLQPGTTTLHIQGQQWQLRVPDDSNRADYLLTLYRPAGAGAELHLMPVDELLASREPHLPFWLPGNLALGPG